MSVSSGTLFHLTKDIETLGKILCDRGFKIQYCKEKLVQNDNSELKYRVPMVSFFDLPLFQLKNHIGSKSEIGRYGTYGIGLAKRKVGLTEPDRFNLRGPNPVIYVEKFSSLNASFRFIYEKLLKGKDPKLFTEMERHILNVFRFSKNYQSALTRNGQTVDYRFSDEREWRWVPNLPDGGLPDDMLLVIPEDIYSEEIFFTEQNAKLEVPRFKFDLQDIEYLIVENEVDILSLIRLLKSNEFIQAGLPTFFDVPDLNYSEWLQTRIITVNQIKHDV